MLFFTIQSVTFDNHVGEIWSREVYQTTKHDEPKAIGSLHIEIVD
jgi:hypothetical protein